MTWKGESRRHSLSRKGIKTAQGKGNQFKSKGKQFKSKGLEKPHSKSRIDNIIFKFRMKTDDPRKLTQGYCVEFARAMRDFVGGGDNYQIGGHNVLFYDGMYIDGKGIHTKEELESKYGSKLNPDPDGWAYIYNTGKLKEYRELLDEVNGNPKISYKNQKVSSIIQNQIKGYESSPCEINSGECEEFAWELAKKIPTAKVSESNWDVIFTNPNGKKEWIPTHFWITIDNLHYDAETPEGVDDYHKLPIFIRAGVPEDINFLINWGND